MNKKIVHYDDSNTVATTARPRKRLLEEEMEKNCLTCYWWREGICENTNWKSGSPTDPAEPVCVLMSWRRIERNVHHQGKKLVRE